MWGFRGKACVGVVVNVLSDIIIQMVAAELSGSAGVSVDVA